MRGTAHHIHLYTRSTPHNLCKASSDNNIITVSSLNVYTIPGIVGELQIM